MMASLDFIVKYWVVITIVAHFGFGAFLLWMRNRFAPKSVEDDIKNLHDVFAPISLQQDVYHFQELMTSKVDKVQAEVKLLQQQVEHLPTIKDFHGVKDDITKVNGAVLVVNESLKGMSVLMKRSEKQVNRIEDFLRSKDDK